MATICLNPCCSGRWSRTNFCCGISTVFYVLILVVVDDGLVRDNVQLNAEERTSLNPCCSGRWFRTMKELIYVNPCKS